MLAVSAHHGMGMALIPEMMIENELNIGELVIVSNQKLAGVRAYYLVHSSQESTLIIRKFVDWIQPELPENRHISN